MQNHKAQNTVAVTLSRDPSNPLHLPPSVRRIKHPGTLAFHHLRPCPPRFSSGAIFSRSRSRSFISSRRDIGYAEIASFDAGVVIDAFEDSRDGAAWTNGTRSVSKRLLAGYLELGVPSRYAERRVRVGEKEGGGVNVVLCIIWSMVWNMA